MFRQHPVYCPSLLIQMQLFHCISLTFVEQYGNTCACCTMVLRAPYFRIIEYVYGWYDGLLKDNVSKCFKSVFTSDIWYLAGAFYDRNVILKKEIIPQLTEQRNNR